MSKDFFLNRPVSVLYNKSLQRSSQSSSVWFIIQNYFRHPVAVHSCYMPYTVWFVSSQFLVNQFYFQLFQNFSIPFVVKKCISRYYSENFILTDVNHFLSFFCLFLCCGETYGLHLHAHRIDLCERWNNKRKNYVGCRNRMYGQSWLHKAGKGERVVPSQQELWFQA